MREINLRSIDLNLLTIFEAVFEECSQIKASERLGMTQPAVSHAMARLRHLVDDPLFIVRGRALTATPRSEELYIRVHEALELVREELQHKKRFDLAGSQRTFVMSISHGAGTLSGPQFMVAFRESAPLARLVIRHVDPEDEVPQMLRDQRLDLAYHHVRHEDPMLEHLPTNAHELVLVVSSQHPRIQEKPELEALLQERFAVVYEPLIRAENDSYHLHGFLKEVMERTSLEVPSASQLPLYLVGSDLVGITSKTLARWMAQTYGISFYPLPLDLPPISTYLIWHRERQQDPIHRWFRETFMQTLKDVGA